MTRSHEVNSVQATTRSRKKTFRLGNKKDVEELVAITRETLPDFKFLPATRKFEEDHISIGLVHKLSTKTQGKIFGAFALKDFPSNTILIVYTGTVRNIKKIDNFDYSLRPSSQSTKFVDARNEGNGARFVNYSGNGDTCNCAFVWIPNGKETCPVISTTRAIKKGEQLLVDYGENYFPEDHAREFLNPSDDYKTPEDIYSEKKNCYRKITDPFVTKAFFEIGRASCRERVKIL